MTNKNRMDEITITRAFAICCVIFVHIYASATLLLSKDSLSYPFYLAASTLARFGTPTFMMLSSFILFYVYSKRKFTWSVVGKFYKKRLLYIVIPYLFFTVLYWFLKWKVFDIYNYPNLDYALERLEFYITYGKAHGHLYFVINSIQFYILFPFLFLFITKVPLMKRLILPLGIVAQVVWIHLTREHLDIEYRASVIFTYSFYLMLGAFIGLKYDDIKRKMNEKGFYRDFIIGGIMFLYGVAALLFVAYNFLTKIGSWNSTIGTYIPYFNAKNAFEFSWVFYTSMAGITVLLISNYINRKSSMLKSVLMQIGTYSFGIYLIHPIALMILRLYFDYNGGIAFHIQYIVMYIITIVSSYLVVKVILDKLPFGWMIFGSK